MALNDPVAQHLFCEVVSRAECHMDFAALRDKSIQTTDRFHHTEAALGTTFADLARRYKETGNTERDETSKRNAQGGARRHDFKGRLPSDLRAEIETRRAELAGLISML